MDSATNDSKSEIARLRAEYDATNDPAKRAELNELMADIAGAVGEFGLDADLD